MMVKYDDEVDVLYVAFRHIGPGDSKQQWLLDDRRIIDVDAEGEPLGVEFLCYSDGIDLEGVPRAEEIAHALEALAPA
jgi:uncharacterized protein YuzE